MKAALLPDRGVVKVAGNDAAKFLIKFVTAADIGEVTPASARFAALLTPQGKIVVDFIMAAAEPADGGGFFFDCPRALASTLVERLNFYKLRAKVINEDLSEVLGVLAIWDGAGATEYGLVSIHGCPDWARAACCRRILRPRPPVTWVQSSSPPKRTKPTASRSVCPAAGSISSTATPFRTKPTWISLAASISPRAALSARRSPRAWSIAAPLGLASSRSRMTARRPRRGRR